MDGAGRRRHRLNRWSMRQILWIYLEHPAVRHLHLYVQRKLRVSVWYLRALR